MNTIELSTGTTLEVELLHHDEFFRDDTVLYAPPTFTSDYTLDDYEGEKRTAEHRLRTELSKRWTEIDDFEVGWDENFALTLCGSISTPRIICREYLEILHRVLQDMRMKNEWMFDTSLEPDSPIDGMMYCHFRLRGNVIKVRIDGIEYFDFVRAFSRSAKEAEENGMRKGDIPPL